MPDEQQPQQVEYPYPRQWEADVVASDGGIVHLRPITPDDADALLYFHGKLSDRTRYLRYFGPYPRISPRDLERFTVVDQRTRVAFLALLGDEIIAVGRYEGLTANGGAAASEGAGTDQPVTSAEVAFVVRDDHQSRGLGSILLEHLAAAARENGLSRFEAEVLVENHAMVRVFREAGYQVKRAFAEGVLHLEFDIDPTEKSIAVRDSREQAAEARSVANLLHPSSVAVIGASADETKIGHAVLVNLLRAGFTGPVYPVNPDARSVRGVRAYPSVIDIPDEVDLAVVAVPAANIDEVMDSCLAKGVKVLVVISSGFADAGGGGKVAERRLVAEARAHGMRVVGPNALGVANPDPSVRLNATLAPAMPGPGRTGFFCQSGALGTAILANARSRGLGLSSFVSAGNRADVSGNDLMQYWQTDPGTDQVLLYLESFGNPRKFARVARRLARTKPIVAVKSGRHTGPLPSLAGTAAQIDESSVQVLFEQSGVIRVQTLPQLFDTALLLAYQPMPTGRRVAVVGNSTAVNLLVTDGLLDEGLEPAGETVDVGTQASPEAFADAVRTLLEGPEQPDALIAVFVPPVAVEGTAHAQALRGAAAGAGIPVLAVFLAAEGIPAELSVPQADGSPGPGSVPSYASPERATSALGRVARYSEWRNTPVGDFVVPEGIDPERARRLVASFRPDTPHALTDDEAVELLACYGLEVIAFRRVSGAEAAVAAAEEVGYPVVIKATGEQWRHRGDFVGVRLDLVSAEAVRAAHAELSRLTGSGEVYVQRMAPKGSSCKIEVVDDPSFGSLIAFGLSGMATELLDDRAYRVLPVSTEDAKRLVRAPRAAPLLTGYRGTDPVDTDALEDVVLRIGQLAEDIPQVRSLALDPVLASPDGAFVTGARVTLGPVPDRRDAGPRRLR
ncbi:MULTISPECIES: bifunctional GNAT family N-acetyltransferase/acetate--CoA ligase family protein [unclassified Pseudonocardia]|uniref:bifunctional acetate--CoA ligase family protein/GNAT family N-acetyltransferase n=1 Tax=unclassified Pseudonocardia TaxID=2619320 RepID=UPI0001FFEB7A|nr:MULTISPECIES: bifunctional GNAT family N-acetyltransferase/acetate--CoA ligase family protein [unclassified Pseudonocardia]ALE74123.1 CoA-binding protein [Pseudonocardia sp. EC080625-04]ALL77536.1 CoA-binding protein [Pseudonocardia sp. EC080610-09]ALL80452.1 CoA-binding protein [Pseudonocardia sp. EC080619-01]OLM17744.1 Protein acetyltransferase [Pseudonocardia sp. Ae707_Ps1]